MADRPWASSSRRGGFLESLGSRLGHKGWVGGREEEEASVVELGRLVVHRWKAGGPRMGGGGGGGRILHFLPQALLLPYRIGAEARW